MEDAAGEKQFSDRAVRDPTIVAVRDKVVANVDPAIHEEQVRMYVRLKDGRTLEKYVAHAIGSFERPMSDAVWNASSRTSPKASCRRSGFGRPWMRAGLLTRSKARR